LHFRFNFGLALTLAAPEVVGTYTPAPHTAIPAPAATGAAGPVSGVGKAGAGAVAAGSTHLVAVRT
jgi:hypothetical protein